LIYEAVNAKCRSMFFERLQTSFLVSQKACEDLPLKRPCVPKVSITRASSGENVASKEDEFVEDDLYRVNSAKVNGQNQNGQRKEEEEAKAAANEVNGGGHRGSDGSSSVANQNWKPEIPFCNVNT